MPALEPPGDAVRAFADAAAFRAWLESNCGSCSEIYLRIYKKGSGIASVSYAEALDEALCFGWIDGVKKAYDAESFLQRFSPRKPGSIWSQRNREHVQRLIAANRMTARGQREIEAAKANGRWDSAYAAGRDMQVPDELMAAIEADERALATFRTLNRHNVFALAFRIGKLKTEEARRRKIAEFVAMLARGETIHPNGRAKP